MTNTLKNHRKAALAYKAKYIMNKLQSKIESSPSSLKLFIKPPHDIRYKSSSSIDRIIVREKTVKHETALFKILVGRISFGKGVFCGSEAAPPRSWTMAVFKAHAASYNLHDLQRSYLGRWVLRVCFCDHAFEWTSSSIGLCLSCLIYYNYILQVRLLFGLQASNIPGMHQRM